MPCPWGIEAACILLLVIPLTQGLKLGLIDGVDSVTSICVRAIADAQAAGDCTTKQPIDVLNTTSCDTYGKGTVNAMALYYRQNADAFVAPTCQDEMVEISRLAYFVTRPVISRTVASAELVNLDLFPNVIQVAAASVQALGVAIAQVARQLEVDNLVLVGPLPANLNNALKSYYEQNAIVKVRKTYEFDVNALKEKAQFIRQPGSKLIVLTDDFSNIAFALDQLGAQLLSTKGHVVLAVCRQPFSSCVSDIPSFARSNAVVLVPEERDTIKRKETFQGILGTSYEEKFYDRYRTTYDACYAYCWGTKKGNTNDGSSYADTFTNATWTNSMGTTRFDGGYSLMQTYSVYRVDASNNLIGLLTLEPTPKTCINSTCLTMTPNVTNPTFWMNAANTTISKDGMNEISQPMFWLWIVIGIVLLIILAAVGFGVWQRNNKGNVWKLTWKVPPSEFKLIEGSKSNRDGPGARAKKRVVPYALIGTVKAEFICFMKVKNIVFTAEEIKCLSNLKKAGHDNLAAFIGVCVNDKSGFFYIMNSHVERASLEAFLMSYEEKKGKEFITDQEFNLDETFKSAFTRDLCRGMAYLHRSTVGYHGLLNLGNCLIDGNWVLKLSQFGFTSMLAEMLSEEKIKVLPQSQKGPVTAGITPAAYLSTAPELLEGLVLHNQFPRGNAKADIYSLGMVLYCIMTEKGAAYNLNMPPTSTMGKVGAAVAAAAAKLSEDGEPASEDGKPGPSQPAGAKRAKGPTALQKTIDAILHDNYRPSFGSDGEGVRPAVKTLLESCWDKNPDKRPTVREIQAAIQSLFAASQGNLIDQMIKMNTKYANDLEGIVAMREALIRETKQNVDRLLNEMLPASIAAQLKANEEIIPRSYEAATVLFCQIVDFGLLIEKTSAEYIISFLNDVFNRFDDIIKAHDAYKVETTGETYMVASGVPSENGGRHVFEIADIALALREKSYAYKVENMEDYKVRVRIGFHCGPIAAGVIGIRSPRYCLFGDTVNFASRMQSNCPANQIQTSEITALKLMNSTNYELVKRGIVKVKGKGDVNCYWLNEHIHGEHGIVAEQIIVGGGRPPTAVGRFARPVLTTAQGGRRSQMSTAAYQEQQQAAAAAEGQGGSHQPDILLIEPPQAPVRLMTANNSRIRRTSKIEEEVVAEAADEVVESKKSSIKKTRFVDEKKSQ